MGGWGIREGGAHSQHFPGPQGQGDKGAHCHSALSGPSHWLSEPGALRFSPVDQQNVTYPARQAGAIRKSSWCVLPSLTAQVPLGFWAGLLGATKWNTHLQGPGEDHLSPSRRRHRWKQTDVLDGAGRTHLQFPNLQRHNVLSLNIHLGPSSSETG